jgi:hypothetical protein
MMVISITLPRHVGTKRKSSPTASVRYWAPALPKWQKIRAWQIAEETAAGSGE